ncbi:hypothetical protein J6590_015450 [Homalodisca vitripennis]|nr:hypothetical protein J6590_015450 [Homalodisca vitripennis]
MRSSYRERGTLVRTSRDLETTVERPLNTLPVHNPPAVPHGVTSQNTPRLANNSQVDFLHPAGEGARGYEEGWGREQGDDRQLWRT